MPAYTRNTHLKNLRPRDLKPLHDMLDVREEKYKTLAASIKKRNGKYMFSTDEIESLQLQFLKRSSPSKEIFNRWKYENPNICDLLNTLQKCKLYREAEYVISDILKEAVPSVTENGSSDSDDESGGLVCPCRYDAPLRAIVTPQQHDENVTAIKPTYHHEFTRDITMFTSDNNMHPYRVSNQYSVDKSHISSEKETDESITESKSSNISTHQSFKPGSLVQFPYEQLLIWTNGFRDRPVNEGGSLIGSGGFAKVFLGNVDGQDVAVKRMIANPDNVVVYEAQFKQFQQEMSVLASLQHKNLLIMHGWGWEHVPPNYYYCIIYEYMENGSLEDRLSCKMDSKPLTVPERLNIIKDAAEGIHFIHTQGLVHRDIKSANILLSTDLRAKIGDCGLVREGPSLDSGLSFLETETITGTKGYIPPEYYDGKVSNKMDAFAFGVVLLEILTGLPCFDCNRDKRSAGGEKYLRRYFIEHSEEGNSIIWNLRDSKCGPWERDLVVTLYIMAMGLAEDNRRKRVTICEVLPQLEKLQS